jgi:hypothetical protein
MENYFTNPPPFQEEHAVGLILEAGFYLTQLTCCFGLKRNLVGNLFCLHLFSSFLFFVHILHLVITFLFTLELTYLGAYNFQVPKRLFVGNPKGTIRSLNNQQQVL